MAGSEETQLNFRIENLYSSLFVLAASHVLNAKAAAAVADRVMLMRTKRKRTACTGKSGSFFGSISRKQKGTHMLQIYCIVSNKNLYTFFRLVYVFKWKKVDQM